MRNRIPSISLQMSVLMNLNECSYYMWKQKFPVRPEFRVDTRMEVDEWVITLAFPYGQRLHRGISTSPGVYAFLPTEMVTNFPFIIQADFLLQSSREKIRQDNKWNQGILDCVPSAFVNAFISLVRSVNSSNIGPAPIDTLPHYFKFLPVESCSKEMNVVRDSIKAKIVEENIVPAEPHQKQKQNFFYKPREVGRLMPVFRNILNTAKDKGVSLPSLSSHGRYVLCQSFDKEEYDQVLSFLGVEPVDDEWYAKCIQSSNLVGRLPEDVYLQLLLFVADNWATKFHRTNIKNIQLIKFVDFDKMVSSCSLSAMRTGERKVCLSREFSHAHVSWLIDWNQEFMYVASLLFMPKITQDAIHSCSRKKELVKWLAEEMKVSAVNVHEYAVCLYNSLDNECKSAIAYALFLYHSWCEEYISHEHVKDLCCKMPIVDSAGHTIRQRRGVLFPASESKWEGLTNSNLWSEDGYVQLAEDYMDHCRFSSKSTEKKQFLEFLKDYVLASDVPFIYAPNACIPTVSAPLTKENAFLILDWIHYLKREKVPIPEMFLKSIKEGSWLKVTLNDSSSSRPPSHSFMLTPDISQKVSVFVDIPAIDQDYYGEEINSYEQELKTIGVLSEFREVCEYIGKHLRSLAASSYLDKENVLSILRFIQFLRKEKLSPDDFICGIKDGQWLKTSRGFRSPVESVLYDEKWTAALEISDIPFVDQEFYGQEEICNFKKELKLLGVAVSFSKSYQRIIDNLKPPSCLTWTPKVILLMLECLKLSESPEKLVKTLKETNCLETNIGQKCPEECLLFEPELNWGCILQVFSDLPLINHNFYGDKIFSYRNELKKTGVVVDFEEAANVFARHFSQRASSASITKDNIASFLLCCRTLEGTPYKFPEELKHCIHEVKWLRTRLGDYRSPKECILFSPEWEAIDPICDLPFIDDSDNCYGKSIHEYKQELKSLGVVVEFKDAIKFVESGLRLPQDPSRISQENALSLLDTVRILLQENNNFLSKSFMEKASQAWLKTYAGYRSPGKCLLFDAKLDKIGFSSYLKQTDGPFIDEEFYGSKITTYRAELSAIGVIVEAEKGCPLIASHLGPHDELSTFVRVYKYLSMFKWEPDSEADKRIWVPKGNQNGEWVSPDDCVIYDKDGLFGLQLTVLEKYFEQNLLTFFSSAFRVKSDPSIDDYLKLWKAWESSGSGLPHDECCKFWDHVSKHWTSTTEKILADALVKVPVDSASDGILLCNKGDVFIADDLHLQSLFQQSSQAMFVWYPKPSLASLPRSKLLDIYRKVGVRTISESVQKEQLSLANDVEVQLIPREKLIGKTLLRLILGFLAGPPIEMEAEKRRKAVQGLVDVTVLETTEPIAVSYDLPLSSGGSLNVIDSRKIRWDTENSKFFIQKMDKSGGQKIVIEFATYFSEAISECVLWESTDHIPALSELIKLAFMLELDEEAIDFLMESKNLQIFVEDEEFLHSAYPTA